MSTVRPPGGPAGLRSDSTRYEADLEFRFRPAVPTTYPPRRRRNDLVTGEGPQLELRREDDVVVLAISGEFDVSSSASLDGMREEALEVGRPVVVDLTSCEFIDSHGLAGIIRIFNRATASDIPFALAGSGKQVKRVLDVSGLAHALPYFGELKDAIDHARLHEGERAKSPPIRFPPRI